MKTYLSTVWVCLLLGSSLPALQAQTTPEFPQGFVMHLRVDQGLQTNFHQGGDAHVMGLNLTPAWTIWQGKMRVGAVLGGYYAGQQLGLMAGPSLQYLLKTYNAGSFGSAANLHVSVNHVWGSDGKAMAGAGIYFEALQKIVFGISAQKDYGNHLWWLQTSLGIRISKIKKIAEPFNE